MFNKNKLMILFLVFSMLFDTASTLFFINVMGVSVEHEVNRIAKFLIKNRYYHELIMNDILTITGFVFLYYILILKPCEYFREIRKERFFNEMIFIALETISFIVPFAFIFYGGFSWIFMYFRGL